MGKLKLSVITQLLVHNSLILHCKSVIFYLEILYLCIAILVFVWTKIEYTELVKDFCLSSVMFLLTLN